jgi:hypothetical protein
VLERALVTSDGEALTALLHDYTRNRVIPKGADSLLAVLTRTRDPLRAETIHMLVGRLDVDTASFPLLTRLSGQSPRLAAAVAGLLASQGVVSAASAPLLSRAALDSALPADLRVRAVTALDRLPGSRGVTVPADVYARLTPALAPEGPLADAWRRFAGDRRNAGEIGYFEGLTRGEEPGARVLGYAALLQVARTQRNAPELRSRAAAAIEVAWDDPARASDLVRAIERMNAQELYLERLRSYRAAHPVRRGAGER